MFKLRRLLTAQGGAVNWSEQQSGTFLIMHTLKRKGGEMSPWRLIVHWGQVKPS